MPHLLTFCEGKWANPGGVDIPARPYHAAEPTPDGEDRVMLCGRPERPLLLIEVPETPFPPRNAEEWDLCRDCYNVAARL